MEDKYPLLRRVQLELRLVGWWPAALSFSLLAFFFVVSLRLNDASEPSEVMYLRRAVESVAPLLFAVQVSFLLGPEDEPALELLSSYPRPLPRLFLERLALVVGMHLLPALTFSLAITANWGLENLGLALVRWLAAGVALGGVAVFTTQLTRHAIFGTLLVTLLWAASLYGGDALLVVWKWFWPFHVYLQPEKFGLGIYLLNRLVLTLAGLALGGLALKFLGDGDRLLGTR